VTPNGIKRIEIMTIDRPTFLPVEITPEKYRHWLDAKTIAHVKHDKKRGNETATFADYQRAIHEAVPRSKGRDAYTGELLNWSLIGTYDNARSKAERRDYKASLAMLPTLDHVGDGRGPADFEICGWRTNDAKSDLMHGAFVALCRLVVKHADGLTPSP
jgi:hypothetical protein